MSDDDSNEEHQSPFPFVHVSPAELQQMMDGAVMQQQAHHHFINNWFLSQTTDQLLTIDHLLMGTADPQQVFWRGMLSGILVSRGYCMACKGTHDPNVEMEEMGKEVLQDTPNPLASQEEAQYKASCAEYNVTPDEINPPQVICLGCQMSYVSLDDRMLRRPGPDGCHGCQYKSGHG